VSLHSCLEKVADTVDQLVNPPPIARSPCLSNFPPPFEDIYTLVMVRSEEEQLVGYELIKALRNLKLSMVPHLSLSNRHESPSNNETIVVYLNGNQSYRRQKKVKIKSRKSGFKVVRNMLTRKWIVVKNDRQLSDLMVVTTLFEDIGDVSLVVLNLCRLLMSAGCPSSRVCVPECFCSVSYLFFMFSLPECGDFRSSGLTVLSV
jgi:hypothetical protein